MRKCPVNGCYRQINDRMFVCSQHWQRLPDNTKNEVSEEFNKYMRDEISMHDLHAVTDEVLRKLNKQPRCSVRRLATIGFCDCGAKLVFAGNYKTTQWYSLVEDPEGVWVVIGGEVTAAAGLPKIYTRFKQHWCPPFKGVTAHHEKARK